MDRTPSKIILSAALALVAAALLAASAAAAHGVAERRAVERFAPRQLVVKLKGQSRGRTVALPRGAGVLATARALRAKSGVAYAVPNYVAHASAIEPSPAAPAPLDPDDPGTLVEDGAVGSSTSGGWAARQWNFLDYEDPDGNAATGLPTSPGGIDVVGAWANLKAIGRPGGSGVVVAVLDSGVAYRDSAPAHLRSPDFDAGQFVRGANFVVANRPPFDVSGHGTHVAATIAEATDNGIGLTGIAYGAQLMPIRVLNRENVGYADRIAEGIRFAIREGADVINMSFNFDCGERVPQVDEALRKAYELGIVTVGSVGNLSHGISSAKSCVSQPATGPRVIGVGGTTEGGCLGSYSLTGKGVDVLAPGGGNPVAGCRSVLSRPIFQVTLERGTTNKFTIPKFYAGTSMASAHVSGVVALMLASGVIPASLSPEAKVRAVARRLESTARDLGYLRAVQGAGLIDAARATAP